jgi:hypothetical protein
MSAVKIVINTPKNAQKPEEVGGIKEVKVPTEMARMTARGMGAAKKGGSYIGCK